MLNDPQTLTIGGTANSLPRTSQAGASSIYMKDDGTIALKFVHNVGKTRTRRSTRVDHSKIAADPYLAGTNRPVGLSVIVSVDIPNQGYTLAEQKDVVKSVFAQLQATSDAVLTKWLGGES